MGRGYVAAGEQSATMQLRGALAPLAMVWLVALAGTIAAWRTSSIGGLNGGAVVITLLVAAALATVVVLVWSVRRVNAVARLDRFARRMLADARPAATGEGEDPAPIDPDAVDAAQLGRTLTDLQYALRAQTRELAKKSRNLQSLIDGLDEPVLVFDNEDRVLLTNPAAEAMLGTRAGGLLGRGLRELFTRPEIAAMHAGARGGESRRGRVAILTASGQRTFQVSATPLPPAWGEGVFGSVLVLRDVTELAQSVQRKSEFVASASHELRTPVAAIRAAVETLIDGAKDEPAMRDRMLKMIETHTLRLDEMVRDLLDLSRLEAPEVSLRTEPVDLGEVQLTIEQLFEQALKERTLRLEFDLGAIEELQVVTDVRLLLTVLRNLVENATKHAREGTPIRIAAREVPAPAEAAVRSGSANPVWVRFSVSDKGTGIPLAHQERVFERFYQVDPARSGSSKRGTGLGLAIVKHAVRSLDGRVGLTSEWGQGTTVWFEIPVGPRQ